MGKGPAQLWISDDFPGSFGWGGGQMTMHASDPSRSWDVQCSAVTATSFCHWHSRRFEKIQEDSKKRRL
jgi:hypothetical protein